MSGLKVLFKQTFIYGIATVLPRMLSFILVPLYTTKGVLTSVAEYGELSYIFSWFVLFNVILSYGMETAFFRFYNKEESNHKVVGTSVISILCSSLGFLILGFLFKFQISELLSISVKYIQLFILILFLDAITTIPFVWLRATEKPKQYAYFKIINVAINLGLNVFFLLGLKDLSHKYQTFKWFYVEHFEIQYILIANLIASLITLVLMFPFYTKFKFEFNFTLWKQMMVYAFPVLVAGIAFSINETFDRILLEHLLPKSIAKTQIGMYSACYKLSVFMTLFVTAYKLGIEPFFFSHSNSEKPQKNYALILEIFVAMGSAILLFVVVFADILKLFIVRSSSYWEAMTIVPIILIANLFLGIYHNLSVWYKITDKTKIGAYISIIGAIITLIINVVFIKTYGYKASAIATLAAYFTMMMISFGLGYKYYPIPYNYKKISLYLGISIGFSILSFYLFRGNYYVGISLLIGFLVLVYVLEKQHLTKILKLNV